MINQNDLIRMIAEKAETTREEAKAFLDAFKESVEEALQDGKAVQLTGFLKFEVADRKERKYRNPKTGEEVVSPAHKAVVVKPGKKLKEAVA